MDKIDDDGTEDFNAPSTFEAVKPAKAYHFATKMQQKENQSNKQEITNSMDYKIDGIRMGQSLSKVHSLSSIRDTGCANPMAYTLWHHPTFNEISQTKLEECATSVNDQDIRHNDRWTIHEDWDLLNQLDSSRSVSMSSTTLTRLKISTPPSDEDNDVDALADDDDDHWKLISSPVFVPLSSTGTSGIATNTAHAMAALRDDTSTTTEDPKRMSLSNLSSHRRHSLPEYISRPIARRPLSTSCASSSALQNVFK